MTKFSDTSERSQDLSQGQDSGVELLNLIMAYSISTSVRAAAQLGLADHLRNGSKTIDELARLTHTQGIQLQRILRVLCANRVFREQPVDTYQLDELGKQMLSDSPTRLKDAALMLTDAAFLHCAGDLAKAAAGTPIFRERFGHSFFEHWEDKAIHDVFHQGVAGLSMASNHLLIEQIDVPEGATVVDVGGGIGGLLLLILQQNPSAYGILFDQAQVLDNSVLPNLNQPERWKLVSGDFFESCPAGDIYLLQMIIHDWSDEQGITILRNCKRGMSENGRILILESVIEPNNQPDGGKLLDLITMCVLEDSRERTLAEFEALFEQAGLRLIRRIPTAGLCSILEVGHK